MREGRPGPPHDRLWKAYRRAPCAADAAEPSHVLLAMGLGEEAHSSVGAGMGRFNTFEYMREASGMISGGVRSLKKLGARALRESLDL